MLKRLPQPIRKGATILERWLLNRGKYELALKVRPLRGIAITNPLSLDMEANEDESKRMIGMIKAMTKAPEFIAQQHCWTEECGDLDWSLLRAWLHRDTDIDKQLLEAEADKKRDSWISALSIYTCKALGYGSEGVWCEIEGVEYWDFCDGSVKLHWSNGEGYMLAIGKRHEL